MNFASNICFKNQNVCLYTGRSYRLIDRKIPSQLPVAIQLIKCVFFRCVVNFLAVPLLNCRNKP